VADFEIRKWLVVLGCNGRTVSTPLSWDLQSSEENWCWNCRWNCGTSCVNCQQSSLRGQRWYVNVCLTVNGIGIASVVSVTSEIFHYWPVWLQ